MEVLGTYTQLDVFSLRQKLFPNIAKKTRTLLAYYASNIFLTKKKNITASLKTSVFQRQLKFKIQIPTTDGVNCVKECHAFTASID
jgi:hypothetical protein